MKPFIAPLASMVIGLGIGILALCPARGVPPLYPSQSGSLGRCGQQILALKIDGTLWAWNYYIWGQWRDGTTNTAPVQIGGCDWRWVGDGWGIKADHTLWSLCAEPTQFGTDADWKMVSGSAGLKIDGSLWILPEPLADGAPRRLGTDTNWTTLDTAAGILALKSNGSLWQWNSSNDHPTQIGSDQHWAGVAAGGLYSLLLKDDGSIWEWTDGEPVCVDAGTDWIAVDTRNHRPSGDNGRFGAGGAGDLSLALKRDGSLWIRVGGSFVHAADSVSWMDAGDLVSSGFNPRVKNYSTLLTDGSLWFSEAVESPDFVTQRVNDDIDWGLPQSTQPTDKFRIVRHALGADGKFRAVVGPLSNDRYSVLYRGVSVTNIRQLVALRLSASAQAFQLTDPTPATTNGSAFYRVQQIPIAHPLDSDGDGIDDVYELRHPNFLNPLDASDAAQDFDGDGKSNFEEYRDGTDPEVP